MKIKVKPKDPKVVEPLAPYLRTTDGNVYVKVDPDDGSIVISVSWLGNEYLLAHVVVHPLWNGDDNYFFLDDEDKTGIPPVRSGQYMVSTWDDNGDFTRLFTGKVK